MSGASKLITAVVLVGLTGVGLLVRAEGLDRAEKWVSITGVVVIGAAGLVLGWLSRRQQTPTPAPEQAVNTGHSDPPPPGEATTGLGAVDAFFARGRLPRVRRDRAMIASTLVIIAAALWGLQWSFLPDGPDGALKPIGPDRILTGHGDDVSSVAFSPVVRMLATASYDGRAALWDVTTGKYTAVLTGHHDDTVTDDADDVHAVAFSPDGKTLATASDDGTARLWNVRTGKSTATLTGHNATVSSVAFSPNGKTLATGSRGAARLWDVTNRKITAT
ncbi:MAG: WD40 repeat domain-containing protein, partial [Micromonosporaceae bacterium]